MENYTICNCMKVSYFDVSDAMQDKDSFESVEAAFESVQKATKCSTGCGGCHDKVMDAISELMYK
ncbi:MAG: (2Fe-2S)-binding protein [Lachnospiraceae bacterium]|nr:(2Fe-2S)-binding protein [Lachnospiraceae bacterium]